MPRYAGNLGILSQLQVLVLTNDFNLDHRYHQILFSHDSDYKCTFCCILDILLRNADCNAGTLGWNLLSEKLNAYLKEKYILVLS